MTNDEISFDLDRAPLEDAWVHTNESDNDANWARREFEGLTARQAWQLFDDNVLGASESIGSMPDEAFMYYIVALAKYVEQLDFDMAENASAATDCLFGYLEARKEASRITVERVAPLVKLVLLKLAANQGANDMPVEIYGNLAARAHALLS